MYYCAYSQPSRKNLNSPELSQPPTHPENFSSHSFDSLTKNFRGGGPTKISQLSPKKILNPNPKISQPP